MSLRSFIQVTFVLLGTLSGTVSAQATTSSLIPEVNILRGEFEQTRYLKGFHNPLKSEGRFLLSKADGVVWQSLKPFPSLIVVSKSGKIMDLGKKPSTAKQGSKKPNAAMSKIMLAMLSGDQADMAKYFKIHRTESSGLWTLQLQPKGGMARVFSHVEVNGDRYIHQVVMQEKSGDKTELRFSALSEVPSNLSAEEKKYFQ